MKYAISDCRRIIVECSAKELITVRGRAINPDERVWMVIPSKFALFTTGEIIHAVGWVNIGEPALYNPIGRWRRVDMDQVRGLVMALFNRDVITALGLFVDVKHTYKSNGTHRWAVGKSKIANTLLDIFSRHSLAEKYTFTTDGKYTLIERID